MNQDPSAPFLGFVEEASKKHGVSSDLLKKMLWKESRWNPKAFNAKSQAAGLAQFVPDTAKEWGVDVNDPASSIDGMARYMSYLKKYFKGDEVKAVAAYNWGMGNVERKGLTAAPAETRDYVKHALGVDLAMDRPHNIPRYFSAQQQSANEAAIQREAEKAQEATPERSAGELRDATVRKDWLHNAASSVLANVSLVADPEYRPRSLVDETKHLESMGLPSVHAARLREAVSQDHYNTILTNIQEEMAADKVFEGQGLRGLGHRILWNMLDPSGIAIGLSTGGIGAGIKGKALYTAVQAAVNGGTAAAMEAALYATQETRERDDIWASLIAGGALGGALGAALHKGGRTAHNALIDGATLDAAQAMRRAAVSSGDTAMVQRLDAAIAQIEAREAELPVNTIFGDDSVGAARVEGTAGLPDRAVIDSVEDIIDAEGNMPTYAYSPMGIRKLRQDIAGFLGTSENAGVRALGAAMVEDGAGLRVDAEGKFVGTDISAEEIALNLTHTTESKFLREMNAVFEELDQGGLIGREQRRKQFSEEVNRLYLAEPGTPMSPEYARAVKALEDFFEPYKQRALATGLMTPDDLVQGKRYLPNISRPEVLHEIVDEVGLENLIKLLEESAWSNTMRRGDHIRDPQIYLDAVTQHDTLKTLRGTKLQSLQKAQANVMSLEAQVRQAWKNRGTAEGQSLNDLTAENLINDLDGQFTPDAASMTKETKTLLWELDKVIDDLGDQIKIIEKSIVDERLEFRGVRTRNERQTSSHLRKILEEQLSDTKKVLKEHQNYRKQIEMDLEAGQRELELFLKNKEVEASKKAKVDKKDEVQSAKADVKKLEQDLRAAKEKVKLERAEYEEIVKDYHEAYRRVRKEKEVFDNWEATLRDVNRRHAKVWAEDILRNGSTRHLLGKTGFDVSDADTLRDTLVRSGMAENQVDDLVSVLGAKPSKSDVSRTKHRIEWDLNTSLEVKKPTGEKVTLNMRDLFVKDVFALTQTYSRQMAGPIALAEKTGIKNRSQFDSALNRLRDMQPGHIKESDRFMKEVRYLQNAYERLMGTHMDHDPKGALAAAAAPWVHRLLKYNFITKMSQVGFSQIAEFGRSLQTVGLQAAWKQAPVLREVYKMGADGHLKNALLRELEAAVGLGTQRLRNGVFTGVESETAMTMTGKVDEVLHKGTNFIADISGMNALTTMQQRMVMAGVSQRFVDLARKFDGDVSKFKAKNSKWDNQLKEFSSYGLTEEKLAKVFAHLNDPDMVTIGKGNKLHKLNLEKWDVEASSAFIMALQRMGRRVIQEGSIGTSLPLMSTLLGKILLQFRSFAVSAVTKQTLNGMAQRDARVFLGFLASMFFGSLAYMLRTSANYGGTDSYEEKMSLEKIAMASLAMTGYSSLIPTAIDTLIETGSGGALPGPFGNGARSSNQAVGFLTGNATMDTIGGINTLLTLPFKGINETMETTQKDVEQVARIVPLGNALIIRRGVASLAEEFPKNSGAPRVKSFFDAINN